jgi:hypothetical protein
MECNSVVECCADNAEGVSSNLTIPIVAFRQHKTLMGCFKTTLEVWQSGLLQNPAKIPCLVIGTVGSNPTTSVRQYSSVWQSTGLICLWSIVQIYLLPCVVSLVVKASVCGTEEMSSILIRHPALIAQW